MSSPQQGLTPLDTALEMILEKVFSVDLGMEELDLDQCVGRILARDVISDIRVPPTDNSAVDGYVVSADLCGIKESQRLSVVARIAAGCCPSTLPHSSVARIFTGASVPENGAAVVMQEDCQTNGDEVVLPANIKSFQNIRPAGQDIEADSIILNQGIRLKPADIGLAASIGLAKLCVQNKLRVAIFSTGDELVEPGQKAPTGKIFNSNRYILAALLTKLSVETIDLGIVPDDFQTTVETLKQAEKADLIISSGGVSVGEEDHVKAALEKTGKLQLWKLAIKPGKPLAFGWVGNTPFMGLPGNPSSVFVTFCLIAIKVIGRLRGQNNDSQHTINLPAFFEIKNPGGREEYVRVRLSEQNGVIGLEKYPNQSSGVLRSASWADGFGIIPIGQKVKYGDLIGYMSYSSLGV